MLKLKPTYKKPQSAPKKVTPSQKQNLENTKPISFNTKGYFSPDEPFNQEYLKVKMDVFKKYRDQEQQLIVLDTKNIHPGAFIQRGMLKPNNDITNVTPLGPKNMNQQKLLSSFVKNYINRKEKKEKIDDKKYAQSTGGTLSEIRALQPSVRDFQSSRSSRASKSIMHSRQSTARSIFSYQDLQ